MFSSVYSKVLLGAGLGWLATSFYYHKLRLPEAVTMDFPDYCRLMGYRVEEYKVKTEDNYILTLYRLGKAEGINANKEPLLMVHGLTHSSHTYVVSQTSKAPAFQLVDNDFDVWLINTRGNYLSRSHSSLSPSEDKFWEWCADHIGHYDIPATIDFILTKTGKRKLSYLGHSQGTYVALYCFAMKPEYADKVKLAVLWTPVGPSLTVKCKYVADLFNYDNIKEFENQGLKVVGDYPKSTLEARKALMFPKYYANLLIEKYNVFLNNDDPRVIAVYLQKFTGGTSLMNLKFWTQVKENPEDALYTYDYGEEINLQVYGQPKPKRVNLHEIRCKLALMGGKYDTLITPEDFENNVKHFPKDKVVWAKGDYKQDHSGFAVSNNQEHVQDTIRLLKQHLLITS